MPLRIEINCIICNNKNYLYSISLEKNEEEAIVWMRV